MIAVLQQSERAFALWKLLRGRLRARLLAARGAVVGNKVSIGQGCIVDRPWCVEIGERVLLESDVYLKVVSDTAFVKLGEFTFIGRGVELDVLCGISVGSHSLVAPGCFITDHSHGVSSDRRMDQQSSRGQPVVIGADVWLGAGVVVLPGVKIGDGAVVGANSVVTSDVAPMAIVAGVPARFLRKRSEIDTNSEIAIK